METTDSNQSLEEREAELCITAAWLSSNLKSLSKIAQELSVKADELAAERRACAKRERRLPDQPPPTRPEDQESCCSSSVCRIR